MYLTRMNNVWKFIFANFRTVLCPSSGDNERGKKEEMKVNMGRRRGERRRLFIPFVFQEVQSLVVIPEVGPRPRSPRIEAGDALPWHLIISCKLSLSHSQEVQSLVVIPEVGPRPRSPRIEAGDALPHLLDPLRGICSEVNPLHFVSVAREICKLMYVVGSSPGDSRDCLGE